MFPNNNMKNELKENEYEFKISKIRDVFYNGNIINFHNYIILIY